MALQSSTSSARTRHPQSTQTLIAAAVTEAVAVLMLVLAFVVNVGSPSTVLATFLGFIVVSVVAATLAFILALVGLLRFARHTGWFVAILVLSVLANPVLWVFLIGYFS
ncbi:MAG: hypothetical protein SPI83_03965 [Rothia sp. (in: high G+C Gram-positive bacteria)]|nr:hypothetical protein [Rothia sp. (in: high G+C Gram-positive bacteria)]